MAAITTIRVGNYDFDGPFRLEVWDPPQQPGVYVVMHRADPKERPGSYTADYIGESEDLSKRGFPWAHSHAECYLSQAPSKKNVYIAIRVMPGSSEEGRREIEKTLIRQYTPPCNFEE